MGNHIYRAPGINDRNYLYLPRTRSRYLRLNLLRSFDSDGVGIKLIEVKPYDFSRSFNQIFQSIAQEEQPGLYPKYLYNRQTYWTPVGSGRGDGQALFNEEGMVEPDAGTFSIAPFLYWDGRLITWADAACSQKLKNHYLPIPTSAWQIGCLVMKITAYVAEETGKPVLIIRYSVENGGDDRQSVTLFTALLPFQVTPDKVGSYAISSGGAIDPMPAILLMWRVNCTYVTGDHPGRAPGGYRFSRRESSGFCPHL